MKLNIEKPNPDGLDEVYNAYHTLVSVLKHADLTPGEEDEMQRHGAEAIVEEAADMLEAWLVERFGERL